MRVKLCGVLVATLLGGCALTPSEDDPAQQKLNDLDARVARLERSVANQVEVSQRLDQVQASLRELSGRLDQIEHNDEALSKQQHDLSADLDKRVGALGPGAAGAEAGAAGAAGSNAPSPVEQAVYNQAFDALKAGGYSTAITGFKDFLHNYPASPLADNAQYWLGETYYVNHNYELAAGAFRTVLKKWPDSRKAPDALLKLGYTQVEQKQYQAARATLDEVTKKYPGSPSAKLAADRLRRMAAPPAAPQPSQSD